jgi:hypothetical protein
MLFQGKDSHFNTSPQIIIIMQIVPAYVQNGVAMVQSGIAQVMGGAIDNTLKLDFEETLTYRGTQYLLEPLSCYQYCFIALCPCKPFINYIAKGGKKIVYYNNCTCGPPCCVEDWKIKYVENEYETDIGSTSGFRPNGCYERCCSCGNRPIQLFYDSNGTPVYSIRRVVNCQTCLMSQCSFCGVCCALLGDSCAWLASEPFLVMTEAIFDAEGTRQMGEVHQIMRIECCSGAGCCVRKPVRYTVKMNENAVAGSHDAALVGILPVIYRGVQVPCQCCTGSPATPLTGVSCVDAGRSSALNRGDLEWIMEISGSPEELEMAR